MKRKMWCGAALAVAVLAGGLYWATRGPGVREEVAAERADEAKSANESVAPVRKPSRPAKQVAKPENASSAAAESQDDEASGDEAASADEKRVDAFDGLVDKWMEPSAKPVTMEQVAEFNRMFRDVPADRRDECLHRALNLVPDENVMLLAGILLDKSYDKDTLDLVFSDILNRGEEVKKPILKLIAKDKTHPCWADVAWILDVTGESSPKP